MGSKIASTLVQTPPERGDGQNQTGLQILQNSDVMLERLQEDKSVSDDKRK